MNALTLDIRMQQKSCSPAHLVFVEMEDKKPILPSGYEEWMPAIKEGFSKEGKMRIIWKEEKPLILFNVGLRSSISLDKWRNFAAMIYKKLAEESILKIDLFLPKESSSEMVQAIAEGFWLASYRLVDMRSEMTLKEMSPSITHIYLIGGPRDVKLDKVHDLVKAVFMARYLVDHNASLITPSYLASVAEGIGKQSGVFDVAVHSRSFLQEKGMGLFCAVAQGSTEEPRLITLRYRGDEKSDDYIAFVGKGVTYDTGGYNIKPTGSMESMKCDMAGAGALLGLADYIGRQKPKINVILAIGATTNMVGPDAYLPGDVFTSYRGMTVEVTNTDAEGRLVLADVLAYTEDMANVKAIIDIATLTGAAELAFGMEFAACYATETLEKRLLKSALDSDEGLWPMPLSERYDPLLQSSIADMVNSPKKRGGSINAAARFLRKFTKAPHFAHLDIAGVAMTTEHRRPYQTSAATGFGVRLFAHLLEEWTWEGL